MRNWKKTALKSAHADGFWSRKDEGYGRPQEEETVSASGGSDDSIEYILDEMAVYFEDRIQEEIEAVEREMSDVEIPPQLYEKLGKIAGAETKERRFFGDKKHLRTVSALCALFLTVAVGVGVLFSPQSDDLREALYELISGSNGTEEMAGGDSEGKPDQNPVYSDFDENGGISSEEAKEERQLNSVDSGREEERGSLERLEESGYYSDLDTTDVEIEEEEPSRGDEPDRNMNNGSGQTGGGSGTDESDEDASGGNGLFPSIQPVNVDPSRFPESVEQVYYPSYLPEGYQRTFVSEGEYMDIVFENWNQQTMITLQYDTDGSRFYESAAEGGSNVVVNGSEGILYYRNLLNIGSGQKVICWNQNGVSLRVQCAAANVSDSEVIQIAESVSLTDTDAVDAEQR